MDENSSIIEFYNLCTSFFSSIITTGHEIWRLFSTKLSILVQDIPEGGWADLVNWIINNLGDYSILEIGLGSGIYIFILLWIVKFLKVL